MNKRGKKPCVRVVNRCKKVRLPVLKIRLLTEKILKRLKEPVECHLVFVSDLQIKRINKLFHASDTPTDVLAFEKPARWPSVSHSNQLLGEVVISLDRARVYARKFGVPPSEELARYIIHGILHLLGERDHTRRLQKKMFKRQEALLRSLGRVEHLLK